MRLSRHGKDNLLSIAIIALAWSAAAVLFVTFRYSGIDREITGIDANYFDVQGMTSPDGNLHPVPFRVARGRAYFEFGVGGLIGGILAGVFEILVFPKRFRKRPFVVIILTKTALYVAVLIVSVAVAEIISLMAVQQTAGEFVKEYARQMGLFFESSIFLITVLLVCVVGLITTMVRQLATRLGHGVLGKIIIGKYHSPREEERVFMFLDLKNSTMIAEHLGHLKFSAFLKEYFYEISDEIHRNGGEVDQYIGDEIVVTWPGAVGIARANCIRCHFDIMEKLARIGPEWEKKYGVAPIAKAGFHVGKVIMTEVGVFKQEVVFLGDTVNTAARIQGECNRYGKSILVSGELIDRLELPQEYVSEPIASAMLRGKEHPVELFSIERQTAATGRSG